MSVLTHLVAAGEPSKVPFYLAGALLAAWAVVLAAIGLSRPEFPGSTQRARGVMALSAILVVATMATAVATASKPTKGEGRRPRRPEARPVAACRWRPIRPARSPTSRSR